VTAPDRADGETFAIITGGGTGGHVYPALALAQELVARGHPASSLRFVGSRRGLEARAVPAAGYEIDLLPGRGFQRRLSFANLRVVWDTIVASVRAGRIVRRLRPHVVVGVGGYASLPCVGAARLRRVATVVHEQNAAPGLANRVAVALRARPAISLPGTPLRGAVLTGNPVRPEIAAVRRSPDPVRPLVAVFGGSLGARRINEAAFALYERWRSRVDVAVRHITGTRDYAELAARFRDLRRDDDLLRYELIEYEEHMDELYRRTSLAVCRAGAVTVAELAVVGLPAVLVPLGGAPGNHQTRNAEALVSAGAAVLVPDAECDGARLETEIDRLLGDPDQLAAMSVWALTLARPDAAGRLADFVEEVASDG
jgi:UDP-N-acetylglucosamine--N-acetylmuramyl-(pentapeptide) pyrophosphoryl-undecaprenol N-acetylglucosamine transferase